MPLPLDASSFENGFPTTKELVCFEFDEEVMPVKLELHTKVVFSQPVVIADFMLVFKL
jgi:hypothetical protein